MAAALEEHGAGIIRRVTTGVVGGEVAVPDDEIQWLLLCVHRHAARGDDVVVGVRQRSVLVVRLHGDTVVVLGEHTLRYIYFSASPKLEGGTGVVPIGGGGGGGGEDTGSHDYRNVLKTRSIIKLFRFIFVIIYLYFHKQTNPITSPHLSNYLKVHFLNVISEDSWKNRVELLLPHSTKLMP